VQRSLFIHAANVHQGGGKSLLIALLAAVPGKVKALVQLDSRMMLPANVPENLTIKFVKPSIWQRFRAEWWLAQNAQPQDSILCFGNLPPLFKLRGHAVVFIQNRYLVDDLELDGFSFMTRLRIRIERLWLSGRMANVDEFVVQTPSMKNLLDARTRGIIPVQVLPFMDASEGYKRSVNLPEKQREKEFDFLYVASGEPHKNHRRLIEAWCLLAKEGLFPSLTLTLDSVSFAELCSWMAQKIEQYRLNVENAGTLPHEQVNQLYNRAGALIYPSTFESFGLPLIEARQAGLPVLASELDYVRDVLDPEQAFNPESSVSIAKAVKRFMGIAEPALPLQNAVGFMKHILEKAK
jgi:glycosyltransferase involved in cell wall biosynthesis